MGRVLNNGVLMSDGHDGTTDGTLPNEKGCVPRSVGIGDAATIVGAGLVGDAAVGAVAVAAGAAAVG